MDKKKVSGPTILCIKLLRYFTLYILYYIMIIFSGFGILYPRKKIKENIIELNNRLIYLQTGKKKFKNILLLLPHCLQYAECPYKVTFHITNCRRCGMCQLKDLIQIAEDYDFDLFIATGGTIARRIVAENKPEFIIAVACERDLFSGIRDAMPLPVYGIPNITPYGPCFNTQVPLKWVNKTLHTFCER